MRDYEVKAGEYAGPDGMFSSRNVSGESLAGARR